MATRQRPATAGHLEDSVHRSSFTVYTRNHETKPQYIMDRPIKPAGTCGYEMLREDALNPKHERNHERHMNTFRRNCGAVYHHTRPFEQAPEQWDGGKIVDRGRGKGAAPRIQGTNNPLTNTWTSPPEALTHRPATAGSQKLERRWIDNGDMHYTRQKAPASRDTFGAYDPIRHNYMRQPDQAAEAVRSKEQERIWGTRGIAHRAPQGSYDPIKHEWKSTPNTGRSLEHAEPTRRKKMITNGESWGSYNPIQNEWQVRPASPAYEDQFTMSLKAQGHVGSGRARVQRSQNAGVYDPIRNSWVVPPQNPRMIEGLAFQPRSLFDTYGRRS